MEALCGPIKVVEALLARIKVQAPWIQSITFDPSLSYETGMASIRSAAMQNQKEKPTKFPALVWTRTNVVAPDWRAGIMQASLDSLVPDREAPLTSSRKKVVSTQGAFDFRFIFVTNNMVELEVFELEYTSRRTISSIKGLEVDLQAQIGATSPFMLNWEELDDVQLIIDQNYYKVLAGSCNISGWFHHYDLTDPSIRSTGDSLDNVGTQVVVTDPIGTIHNSRLFRGK